MDEHPEETLSLTEFKRLGSRALRKLSNRHRPLVLTVKGKPAFVLQTTRDYRRHIEDLERAQAIEGIRRGLESMQNGQGIPAQAALTLLEDNLPYLRRP